MKVLTAKFNNFAAKYPGILFKPVPNESGINKSVMPVYNLQWREEKQQSHGFV